jgi:hypothetical protein
MIDADLTRLPSQLRRLIAVLGMDATERLLIARGGTRLVLPRTAATRRTLAILLGSDAAVDSLAAAFDRLYIDLPTASKLAAMRRNAEIRASKGQQPAPDVARKYRLTAAYVRMIWSEPG